VWLIAPAAILGCLYLFSSLTAKTILFFFVWNVVGVLVYFAYARRNSKLGQARA
jgi:APA family basic amino acid/polyamine antiporter